MVDIRLPTGQIIKNIPDNLSKEEIKQTIIDKGLLREQPYYEAPTTGDIAGRTVRGALRQAGSMIPLVGGYVDEAEAAIRAIGDSTREEELAKIRQEQQDYENQLKRAGVYGLSKTAEIGGGIGAGIGGIGAIGKAIGGVAPRLSQAAQTLRGQVATGSAIGAVEGAGFADENAKTGAVVGALTGGAAPAILGAPIARALGKTEKYAGQSLDKLASTDEGVSTVIKGIDASPRLATELKPLAEQALQNTEQRVQNTVLKELGVKNVDEIAAPARMEYNNFMQEVGDELIPEQEVGKLFARQNVRNIARKMIENDPEKYAGVPQNSIRFLQDIKSEAARLGRTASGDAPYAQSANKAIKDTIDSNFSGFKELNQKYAQSIEAEDLANRLTNLNLQEDSNIAKSILRGQNKRDLSKSFGKEKTDNLVKALRTESEIRDNLKSIYTKSKNRAQDRGSLNVLLGGGGVAPAVTRGATYVGAGAINPLLGAGVVGADIAAGAINRRLSEQAVRNALQGGTKANISPELRAIISQQAGRLTGGQL